MFFELPHVKLYSSVYPANSLKMIGDTYLMLTSCCPECSSTIVIQNIPKIGTIVQCTNCNRELTVTWLYPIMLDSDHEEKSAYLPFNLEIESNGKNLGTN